MSFRPVPAPPERLNRCQLFAPASRPDLFPKMAASAADVVNLDLEDAVAPGDKAAARANAVEATHAVEWGARTLSVRINALDGAEWYRDVIDLVERGSDRLDLIMIPKVGCAADVHAVDALVSAAERAVGRTRSLGLEVLIESAAGLSRVGEIAAASPRLQSMSLGAGDLAASMGMAVSGIGGSEAGYAMLADAAADGAPRARHLGDPWHFATVALVAACRTHGLLPVDGPLGDIGDVEGFRAAARRAATLGMVGKWAIHPSQVALANEVFSPDEAAVAHARRVVEAMAAAERAGAGAATLDGRMIDHASIRQARVVLRQHALIAGPDDAQTS